MDDSLQSYESSEYERPNQPWDCGHACEGLRCSLGPTASGVCQAAYECVPQEKNATWTCTRSEQFGGKCPDGPNGQICSRAISTCSPVASIRRRRGAFALWCCTTTLGLTLLTLGASWRDRVIKPGNLSNQHAQIIENTTDPKLRCVACHTAAESGGFDEWMQLIVAGTSDFIPQSQRCLHCHREKIGDAETALLPHGLPAEDLAARTRAVCERLGSKGTRKINLTGVDHEGHVACAACHREHQGALFDLTAMSNGQCAECHQENFRNLAGGLIGGEHPEFGAWPYERRTRIAFDHAMHRGRYFPEKKQAFACRDCHETPERGEIVGVVSYESSCQTCHDEGIKQSFGDGIPLVALPMLDLRAFKAEGFSVGEWPKTAIGDFDGALPPLMRILLSSDPIVRASLEQFGSTFEFADVDPGNVDDLEAAADIAWGIKQLIHELATDGPTAIRERLQSALDCTLTDDDLHRLMGQLPRSSVASLQRSWFPRLNREMASRKAGIDPPISATGWNAIREREPALDAQARAAIVGWQRDDETWVLRYRPQGHASPFMVAWLDALSSSPKSAWNEGLQAALKQLTSQTSAGQCATCHSLDPDEGEGGMRLRMNWYARNEMTHPAGFTRFSHSPHVILPQLRDCTGCHEVNDSVTTSSDYLQLDPHPFQAGFHPMKKQSCAECHAPKLAGDQCTMCHQYHVGSPGGP